MSDNELLTIADESDLIAIGNDLVDMNQLMPNKLVRSMKASVDEQYKYEKEEDWASAVGLTSSLKALRVKFWRRFDEAYNTRKKMNVESIVEGICSRAKFYKILDDLQLAGFLFTRPLDFDIQNRILLDQCFEAEKEILALDLYNDKGNVSAAVLNAKLKIIKDMRDRVMGQSVQRIQQHTLQETKVAPTKALENLEEEMAQLDNKISATAIDYQGEVSEV